MFLETVNEIVHRKQLQVRKVWVKFPNWLADWQYLHDFPSSASGSCKDPQTCQIVNSQIVATQIVCACLTCCG